MKKYLIGFFVLFLFIAQKQPDNKVAEDYYNDGIIHYKERNYKEAIIAFKEGAILLEERSLEQAKYYNNIGFLYTKLVKPQYSQAIPYYEKVIEIREHHGELAGKHCKALGRLYSEIGEYSKSLFFQKKAVEYLEKKENKPNELALTYIEIGTNLRKQARFEVSLKALKQAKKLWNHNIYQDNSRVFISIGNVYLDSKNYQKALQQYLKGLEIIQNHSLEYKQQFPQNYLIYRETVVLPDSAKVLNNIGFAYTKLKQWKNAKNYLEQGLRVKLSLKQKNKASIASSYNNIGEFYLDQQLFKNAFVNYNQAIQILTDTTANLKKITSLDLEYLPTNYELRNSIDQPNLVIYLHDKAKALRAYYQQTKQIQDLEFAYQTYQKNDTLINIILDNISEESQGIWIGKVRNIYEDAIAVSHQLFQEKGDKRYLKAAFEFAESNKAVVMYRALQINQLKGTERPQQLLQNIQSKLSRKDVLIEYFMGEKKLYIFKITKNDIELHSVVKTQQLSEQINQVNQFVSHYETESTTADYNNYIENAHTLYQTLLPNVTNYNRLIIIPDDSLYYTSFTTFLHTKPTNKKDKFDLPYLIKKYQISYGFSSAILLHSFDKATKNQPLQLKIYAPNFDSRRNLSPLLARKSEVEKLENTVNADLEEGFVSLNHFYKSYRDSSTLYFATHAAVSGDSAYLVFSDSILTTSDIYKNLDFYEQSIVLGACATGIGQLQKSEGTMSLTRAFMYKGSTNIISSLWDIDDESTSRITNAYFQNLRDGKNSIEALHAAQLNYLNTPNRLHPKYWAAFTHTGVWATGNSSFNYWWLGVVGLFVLLLIAWFWYKGASKK